MSYYPNSYSYPQPDGTDISNTDQGPGMSYPTEEDVVHNGIGSSTLGQYASGYYDNSYHSIGLPTQYDQYPGNQPPVQASSRGQNLRVNTSVTPHSGGDQGSSDLPTSTSGASAYSDFGLHSWNYNDHNTSGLTQSSPLTSASSASVSSPWNFSPTSSRYSNGQLMLIGMSGSGNGPGSPTSPPQSSGVRVVKPTIGSEAAQEAAHRRRNSDSKSSHKCSLCGRGLTAKHNLDNHINSHYGIKKYRCPYCDQASGTRHVLKRHALKKHPGQPI